MKFKIAFDTDNAAFEDDNGPHEIARVLRRIADDFEAGRNGKLPDGIPASIRDINGNCIGEWKWGRK